MLKASVAVICYESKQLKGSQECPLMLRITKDRRRKYLAMGVSMQPEQWDFQKNEPKRSYPYRESVMRLIEATLLKYHRQIDEFNEEGRDYSLSMLVNAVERPTKRKTFGAFLDEHVAWLKSQKRLGYAASFIDLFEGRNLIVINKEPTPADENATLLIRGDIGSIIRRLQGE